MNGTPPTSEAGNAEEASAGQKGCEALGWGTARHSNPLGLGFLIFETGT